MTVEAWPGSAPHTSCQSTVGLAVPWIPAQGRADGGARGWRGGERNRGRDGGGGVRAAGDGLRGGGFDPDLDHEELVHASRKQSLVQVIFDSGNWIDQGPLEAAPPLMKRMAVCI